MDLILSNEQKFLLYLTSKSLGGNFSHGLNEQELSMLDYKSVFLETKAHTVSLITFSHLNEFKKFIPDNVYSEWKNYALNLLNINYKIAKSQADLVGVLDGKYDYVILKGLASSSYYDKIELRTLGDVDFLIDKNKKEEIASLLKSLGYLESNGEHPNHLVYKKGSADLEMHFEVAGVPYGEAGERVKKILEGLEKTIQVKEFEGQKFNAPTDIMHAIVILLHNSHHLLGEGLGLRHLSDWAVFVQKTKDAPFWKGELIKTLKEIGLYDFAVIMTNVSKRFLGVLAPEFTEPEDEELCSEMILDVLSSGNFGRKDENRASSGMLITERGKGGVNHGATYNLAHSLHKAVLRKKAVKKCPILYPFVYLYKAIRFIVLSIFGKRPSLIKMAPEAKKRKQTYKKLKIFEIEKGE